MPTAGRNTRYGNRFGAARMLDAVVSEVHDVTPEMREITLRGPALRMVASKPGAHLPVEIPGGEPELRTYSVWAHRPADASLTLRVALHHPGGPGSRWAGGVTTGTRVRIGVPRNKIVLDPGARYHVFAGEETGSVPLLAMLAALPSDAEVFGVLETTGPEAEPPAPAGARTLGWVHRGRTPAAGSPVLVRAVRGLDLPRAHGVAYVAGEAATCRAVLRLLIDRGWPRQAVKVQTHWTQGRCGLL
ncbi:siderophore-interacting protein [Amycolatopsis nigrescens]|uniref:siderophore-interacting protein n=1 Tax=Amycolatopsis nigrescens TaxID=381445 RepID=UPI0007C599CD|nr:siderophore-interacting protein [Amycolatopsis nigrescens]